MSSSMQVTAAAMIMTKAGRRIASEAKLRIIETAVLDTVSTNMVAMPMPRALMTEPVTASRGQRPSSWTMAGLFFHRPFREISR